jgi:hypothetical protein
MRSIVLISKVAALVAATFVFSGCFKQQVKPDASLAKKKRIDPSMVRDTTDLGGTLRRPDVGCKTDDALDPKVVYRYKALTLGSNANIYDFCVAEGFEDQFIGQPPETQMGSCPTKLCGESTTSRRGPVDHAALQAIVSLEQSRSLKLVGMHKAHDTQHEHHDVNVHEDMVRFRLNQGTMCTSKLAVFSEHSAKETLSEADRIIAADQKRRKMVSYFYSEGPTITSGDIWFEQTRDGDKFKSLLIIESKFDGRHDSEVFKETILCLSKKGPISLAKSPIYGFRYKRVNSEEWEVFSALREQKAAKKSKKKRRSKKKR